MFSLSGKTALVTGASRGIGRGIALSMARADANVAVNCRENKEEADKDEADYVTSAILHVDGGWLIQ